MRVVITGKVQREKFIQDLNLRALNVANKTNEDATKTVNIAEYLDVNPRAINKPAKRLYLEDFTTRSEFIARNRAEIEVNISKLYARSSNAY